jgi:hypothetical protein
MTYLIKAFQQNHLVDKFTVEAETPTEAEAKGNEKIRNKNYHHNIVKSILELEIKEYQTN